MLRIKHWALGLERVERICTFNLIKLLFKLEQLLINFALLFLPTTIRGNLSLSLSKGQDAVGWKGKSCFALHPPPYAPAAPPYPTHLILGPLLYPPPYSPFLYFLSNALLLRTPLLRLWSPIGIGRSGLRASLKRRDRDKQGKGFGPRALLPSRYYIREGQGREGVVGRP